MSNTTTINDADLTIYGYFPNENLAYATAAVFGALLIAVMIINIRFRSWFFIVIPIASLMEVVGFLMRPHSLYALDKYIVSVLCILLAPTVFAMADYTLIARLMKKTGIEHPVFKPQLVRWIFLAGDIASFIIQCGGGGLSASKDINTSRTGSKILLAGLCISLTVFVFFLFMTLYVHLHLRNRKQESGKWKVLIYILYFDMILLITRSSYRVAEFANLEYHNPISTNETLFYTLDIIEMLIVNILWIPFHPGYWDMLDTDSSTPQENAESTSLWGDIEMAIKSIQGKK